MKDLILEDYKKNKKTFHAFRERIVNLITDLLLVKESLYIKSPDEQKALKVFQRRLTKKAKNIIA
ncbi:MAG: hypothetical protein JWR50_2309 [Mucilaginibacter sp.]|nr:hypothetical protein [Mucilaginibacter sp.]